MFKKMSPEKLTSLTEHYNDTQRIAEKMVKTRDIYFFLIIGIIVIFAFQIFSPVESGGILQEVIKAQLQTETNISQIYINSILWFCLLAVSARYFQTVINLEKQYNYIHGLETLLSAEFDGRAYTREGKSYLKNYAIFSDWMHIVYRYIFPAALIVAAVAKIWNEINLKDVNLFALWLDIIISLALIVSTSLYVYSLREADKDSYKDLNK